MTEVLCSVFNKRINRPVLLLISLHVIFINMLVDAQTYPFRKYGIADGLPQSQSTGIFEDSRGYIWISTRNGLSRFDGSDFITYFRKDGLPSNFISGIIEDCKGILWAISESGLSKYNGKAFEFYPIYSKTGKALSLYSITSDNNDNIYILARESSSSAGRIYILSHGEYSDYSGQFRILDTLQATIICYNRQGEELLITDRYNRLFSWKNNELTTIPGLPSESIELIYYDRGKLIIKYQDSVLEYFNGNIKSVPLINSNGRAEARSIGNYDNKEVEYYNGASVSRIKIPLVPTGIFIDREGGLWTPSENNIYRLISTAFSSFSTSEIGDNSIWTIGEDRNGHIWFGSLYGTLIEFDGVKFITRNEYKKLFKAEPGFYKGSRKLSNGDLWLSTNMGVIIWDGNSFSKLDIIPEGSQVCYIYEDPDDKKVFVSTNRGLFIIDKGEAFILPQFDGVEFGVIEGITKDDNGEYWLSGHKGLVRFNGGNPLEIREDNLPQSYTYTLEKDSFGGLWVTSEEGLFFKSKTDSCFSKGLPEFINKPANSISNIDNTHLIVGRISDICILDLEKFYSKEKDYFMILDKSYGFDGNDCLDNGIIKDKNGRFWILTSDKVVIFEPEKLKPNSFPPLIYITGFEYRTDSLKWVSFSEEGFFYSIPEKIELHRNKNDIKISYTGISMTNPEKVNYQHRLLGYDDNWSLPVTDRNVVYEKLNPGEYSFQLKAYNADGVITSDLLELKFTIIPALWQKALFKVFTLIMILAITVLLTILIVRRIHVKKHEKEMIRSQLSRLQMSSVLRQFDPHFTFNVISSVGSLIMKGEKEVAYEFITKLSGLLRTVLSDGSIIIKPLSDEIEFVRRYCELQSLRFKKRLSYSIDIKENVDLQRLIPKMTIQTFVENAIKHGFESKKEGGHVDITVYARDRKLEIIVSDNGIGREAAKRQKTSGTGYGLRIIGGIFEVMNENNNSEATITITDLKINEIPAGTEIKIIIPEDYRFEFDN